MLQGPEMKVQPHVNLHATGSTYSMQGPVLYCRHVMFVWRRIRSRDMDFLAYEDSMSVVHYVSLTVII